MYGYKQVQPIFRSTLDSDKAEGEKLFIRKKKKYVRAVSPTSSLNNP